MKLVYATASVLASTALAAATVLTGAVAHADEGGPRTPFTTWPHSAPVSLAVTDPAGDVNVAESTPHLEAGDATRVTYRTVFGHRQYGTALRVTVHLGAPQDGDTRFRTRVVTNEDRTYVLRVGEDWMRLVRVDTDGTRTGMTPESNWKWTTNVNGVAMARLTVPVAVFGDASGLQSLRTTVVRGERATVDTTARTGPLRFVMIR